MASDLEARYQRLLERRRKSVSRLGAVSLAARAEEPVIELEPTDSPPSAPRRPDADGELDDGEALPLAREAAEEAAIVSNGDPARPRLSNDAPPPPLPAPATHPAVLPRSLSTNAAFEAAEPERRPSYRERSRIATTLTAALRDSAAITYFVQYMEV